MADPEKTRGSKRPAAPAEPDAAPAPVPASKRDAEIAAARDAELELQRAVVDAVAAANVDELPTIGGPMAEPGLGR